LAQVFAPKPKSLPKCFHSASLRLSGGGREEEGGGEGDGEGGGEEGDEEIEEEEGIIRGGIRRRGGGGEEKSEASERERWSDGGLEEHLAHSDIARVLRRFVSGGFNI